MDPFDAHAVCNYLNFVIADPRKVCPHVQAQSSFLPLTLQPSVTSLQHSSLPKHQEPSFFELSFATFMSFVDFPSRVGGHIKSNAKPLTEFLQFSIHFIIPLYLILFNLSWQFKKKWPSQNKL